MSRAWHEVIGSCELYWKLQCICVGKFQDLGLLQGEMIKFGSYREFFSALIKFKVRFKPQRLTLELAKLSKKQCSPLHNGYYCSCPTAMNASISVFKHSSVSSVKRTASATIENVFPRGYPSVLWSSSSDSGVLLYTNNGCWLRFHFLTDSSDPLTACVWKEERIRSFVYHIAGCCSNCCLVVIMGKRRNSESLWEMEVLQLRRGQQNVSIVSTSLNFLPSDLDTKNTLEEADNSLDPFRVHSVSVLPLGQSLSDSCLNDCNHDQESRKHRLLVQFGYVVAVFELSTSYSCCSISSPLKVWCPNQHKQDFLYPGATTCFLSQDRTIVALFNSNNMKEINVWNMENGKECKVAVPNHPGKARSLKFTKCLAVGHLFTVVAKFLGSYLPTIYIMSTDTGSLFCECDLNSINSPLVSKITSCYFQMIIVREVTQQHQKLLNALELSSHRTWLDTLAHSNVQDLCLIPCVSAHETNVITIAF